MADRPSPTRTGSVFGRAIRAEWIKFHTITSLRVLSIVVGCWIPLLAVVSSLALVSVRERAQAEGRTLIAEPLRYVDAVLWVQLLFVVVAVLFTVTEFRRNQLRVTVLATGSRSVVVFAKATVIALVGAVLGGVGSAIALSLPPLIVGPAGIGYQLDPPTAISLIGTSACYLALIGALTVCFAVLVRNTVVALLVPLAAFSIIPSMLESIGSPVIGTAVGLLPSIAGRTGITPFENPAGLSGAVGLLVLAGWVAVALVAASLALHRRDV
jgi:ABC-2 type transport system permease protein